MCPQFVPVEERKLSQTRPQQQSRSARTAQAKKIYNMQVGSGEQVPQQRANANMSKTGGVDQAMGKEESKEKGTAVEVDAQATEQGDTG